MAPCKHSELPVLDFDLTTSIAQLSVMVAWILVGNQWSERLELWLFRTLSAYQEISMCTRKASKHLNFTNFCATFIVKRLTSRRHSDPAIHSPHRPHLHVLQSSQCQSPRLRHIDHWIETSEMHPETSRKGVRSGGWDSGLPKNKDSAKMWDNLN